MNLIFFYNKYINYLLFELFFINIFFLSKKSNWKSLLFLLLILIFKINYNILFYMFYFPILSPFFDQYIQNREILYLIKSLKFNAFTPNIYNSK